MLNCESLRATSFEVVQYFRKIGLSLFEMVSNKIEETIIKPMISKQYCCTSAQDIFFVADEHVTSWS